jgi:phage gpG-like protein
MPITIEGAEALKETMRKIDIAINPNIQRMGDVARIMMTSIDKTFATNGRGTWKPQAPSTRPGQGGTLEFTGALRASMEPRLTQNSAEVKPSSAVYKYGSVNNYGSKSGRIPARPFMKIWPEDMDDIMEVLEKPVDEAMK